MLLRESLTLLFPLIPVYDYSEMKDKGRRIKSLLSLSFAQYMDLKKSYPQADCRIEEDPKYYNPNNLGNENVSEQKNRVLLDATASDDKQQL